MALFDEIGKKISMTGQGAVNKGKALADVARLNAAVSEEEKKINNLYYQIGKLYVTLHPQDYESDFGVLVNSLVSSQERVSALKQQIQTIKGVTKCENCGAEVSNNIAFCSACGSPMPKKEMAIDENHIKCDGCGAVIDKNLRFCTSCGKPLVKPEHTNSDINIQQSQTSNVELKVCPSCGAEIRDNLKFCTACGSSIDNTENSVNPIDQSGQDDGILPSDKKKCPSCGALMDNELSFCVECGTALN